MHRPSRLLLAALARGARLARARHQRHADDRLQPHPERHGRRRRRRHARLRHRPDQPGRHDRARPPARPLADLVQADGRVHGHRRRARLRQRRGQYTSDRGGSPIPNLGLVIPLGGGFTAGIGAFGVGGMGVDYKPGLYTAASTADLLPEPAGRPGHRLQGRASYFSVGLAAQRELGADEVRRGQRLRPGARTTPPTPSATAPPSASRSRRSRTSTSASPTRPKSDFQDFEFNIPAHTASTAPAAPYPVPGGTDKLAFDQPAVLSGGVAWRALPVLLVAADVQWINWSDVMGKNKPSLHQRHHRHRRHALQHELGRPGGLQGRRRGPATAGPQAPRRLQLRQEPARRRPAPSRTSPSRRWPSTHVTAGLGWDVTDGRRRQRGRHVSPARPPSRAPTSPTRGSACLRDLHDASGRPTSASAGSSSPSRRCGAGAPTGRRRARVLTHHPEHPTEHHHAPILPARPRARPPRPPRPGRRGDPQALRARLARRRATTPRRWPRSRPSSAPPASRWPAPTSPTRAPPCWPSPATRSRRRPPRRPAPATGWPSGSPSPPWAARARWPSPTRSTCSTPTG